MVKKSKILKLFLVSLVISIIFTFLDFLVHYFVDFLKITYYPIPPFSFLQNLQLPNLAWYSAGKFIATFIFSFIILLFIYKKKMNDYVKSLILTLPLVILLEIRYIYLSYYSNLWHVVNMFMHTTFLYFSTLISLKLLKNKSN